MTIPADPSGAASLVSFTSVWDMMLKGGTMMIPLGICSLIVVAVAFERMMVLRRGRVAPKGFAERVTERLKARDVEGAREAVRSESSPLAVVLASGIGRAGRSLDAIEKQMAWAWQHEVFGLRRRLRILTLITAVAPLMGLLGTIIGMIKAFQTVALSGESLGKAELLAEGIYEAMISTAAGLLVAIPALIVYHYFAAMIDRLTHDVDKAAVPIALLLAGPGRAGAGVTGQGEVRTRVPEPELVEAGVADDEEI